MLNRLPTCWVKPAAEDGATQGRGQVSAELDDGMERLSTSECTQLLRSGGVGLLALSGVAEPVLRPVNYVLVQDALIIRTGQGQIFEAASALEPAAFAISQVDRLEHAGWSVIATGKLALRTITEEFENLPLRPWVRAEKNHFVELSLERVSGRRIAEITRRGDESDAAGA